MMGDATTPDHTLSYGDHADQCSDVYLPTVPNGHTVVVIHGGFWRPQYDRMHARAQARAIADLGYVCILPEYRRTPGSPDHSIDDLVQAIAHTGVEQPILIGHSAGGHLALVTGPRVSAAAVISLAGVVDLGRANELNLGDAAVFDFLGDSPEQRPDLDPAQSPVPELPVVLIHGTADPDVPVELSQRLAQVWGPNCSLTILDDVDHMALIDPDSSAWAAVVEALARLHD